MRPRALRLLAAAASLAAAFFVSACGSLSMSGDKAQVLVVDSLGRPLKDAVVLPESESPDSAPRVTEAVIKERSTNAQGLLVVYLDDLVWNGDGNCHLRVSKAGYEDETLTVSKDLFPAVLRVELRPRVPVGARQ